jgi:phosphoglycolate phosphatase
MDVLIDLDGTLVDPKAGIIGSLQYALRGLDLAVPPADDLTWVIGPPLRDAFPKLGVAAGKIDQALALYRENYSGAGGTRPPAMYECNVYDGIEESLDALRRAGCRLIVTTSKPHVFAKPIIREKGLATHFAAIHGSELDGTRDDKAELIAHIIKTERVDPAHAIMVGDRKFDCIGAHKNGLRSLGVTWGYGAMTELREAGASALCSQPKGLHRLALWMLTGHG